MELTKDHGQQGMSALLQVGGNPVNLLLNPVKTGLNGSCILVLGMAEKG
jgi:hypothetical protein